MYSELIVAFVILGIYGFLHIVTIFLLIKLLKAKKNSSNNPDNSFNIGIDNEGLGVVFCKKCKVGFDAKYYDCPKCGTPR